MSAPAEKARPSPATMTAPLARKSVPRSPDAHDRHGASLFGENRRRRAEERFLQLADADRVAVAPHAPELVGEAAPVCDSRRRVALETARQHRFLLLLGQV